MYEEWRMKHGKLNNNLNEKEKKKRFKIFKDNLKHIDEHNAVKSTYKLGLNQFSDLSIKEFRSMYLGRGYRPSAKDRLAKRYTANAGDNLKQDGVVAQANQGGCGSK